MDDAIRGHFQAWLIEERKALRLPGITTTAEVEMLFRAFKAGGAATLLAFKMLGKNILQEDK